MQIPLLHQQIILATERLRDLHRSTMMHNAPVPAAEMEALLQEIRKLYGIALELNNENALQLFDQVQTASKSLPGVKNSESRNPIGFGQDIAANKAVEENIASAAVKEELNLRAESVEKPVIRIEETDKKRIVSESNVKFQESPTIANRFADQKTVGDRIAGNDSSKRFSDNLRGSVTDIKSAIGLNEKFQFINQLFKGDAHNYNSFIDELNKSASSDVAMKSIQKIADDNDWESHAASAKLFMELIERRFS